MKRLINIIYMIGSLSFIVLVCIASAEETKREINEGYTIVLPSNLKDIKDLHVVRYGKTITISEAPTHIASNYQLYCVNDSTLALYDSSRFIGSFYGFDAPTLNNLIINDHE